MNNSPSLIDKLKITTEEKPKLPSEEWDFRRIPKHFTWLAEKWEYARELPWLCSAWEIWMKQTVPDWNLDGKNPRDATATQNRLTVKEAFKKSRFTPNSHLDNWVFEKLPTELRPHWPTIQRLVHVSTDFPTPILRTNVIPHEGVLNSPPNSAPELKETNATWFKPSRLIMAKGALHDLGPIAMTLPVVDDENYVNGVFLVNFLEYSDSAITDSFEEWLQSHRERRNNEAEHLRLFLGIQQPTKARRKPRTDRLPVLKFYNCGYFWDLLDTKKSDVLSTYRIEAIAVNAGQQKGNRKILREFKVWLQEQRHCWENYSKEKSIPSSNKNEKFGEPPLGKLRHLSARRLAKAGYTYEGAQQLFCSILYKEQEETRSQLESLGKFCPKATSLLNPNQNDVESQAKELKAAGVCEYVIASYLKIPKDDVTYKTATDYLPIYQEQTEWSNAKAMASKHLKVLFPADTKE